MAVCSSLSLGGVVPFPHHTPACRQVSWWMRNKMENGISDPSWGLFPTVNLMSCSPSGRAAWAVQSQGNIYRFNEDFRVLIPRASHHFPPTAFLLHAVYIYVQPKNLDGMHSHVLLSGRKGTVFISVGRCLVCRVPISSNVIIVTWYFYDFYALQIMFSEVLVFLREYVCGIYK